MEGSLVSRYRSTRHSRRVAKAGWKGEAVSTVGAGGMDVLRGTRQADQKRNSEIERWKGVYRLDKS